MTAKAFVNGDGVIKLTGELKFPVIVNVRKQLEAILNDVKGSVQIDFSDVHASDSSALSLWMCCLRYAEGLGTEIMPVNVPEEMLEFSRLVGLEAQLS